MAKIFWIAEKDGDTMEMFAFNNKRKAQEKAMELAPHFSFGDTEIPKEEDDDYGDQWLYSGTIDAKDCFLLYREDGMPRAEGFNSEDEAREEYPGDGAGACFPVKLKGGMGSVYMSMEAEGNGTELWTFEDGDIYENKQKQTNKTTMKYMPTFESFIGSQKLNENYTHLSDSGDGVMYDSPEAAAKWAPVLKAFGVKSMDDLVWLGEYFPEKIMDEGKAIKSFSLKNYGDEDPHGEVDFNIYKWKGMLIGEHDDEMRYSATLCKEKDASKWERILKDDEDIDLYSSY